MNIILVDNELKCAQYVLKNTNWTISALVTLNKENPYNNHKRIKNTYTEEDFLFNKDLEEFDYHDLKKLWKAQLKVENCAYRAINDYQLGKWSYYRGYALVKRIFKNDSIDAVIIKGHNHGFSYDITISEMANVLGIDNYNIETTHFNKRTIFNNYTCELIPKVDKTHCNINDITYYNMQFDRECENKYFTSALKKIIGPIFIELLSDLKHFTLRRDRYGISVIDKLKNYILNMVNKIYLDSISCELNKDKKYICYTLHFEPEATVAGRSLMDSQLAVIQMLSNLLPKDWILYVKEHPRQFKLNNDLLSSFVYNSVIYKSRKFYKEISKIQNVKILYTSIGSREIVENCQAMATMGGTIASEAILEHKPVLVFAAERTIYDKISGVYKIDSYDKCKSAIEMIEKCNSVSYDNIDEIMSEYLIDFEDETNGYETAVKSIAEDIRKKILYRKESLDLVIDR